ncbi:cellulose synthase/poly-beta-1,6-N-acetylglucosamine synthase-like glycosyltransferase [Paenibacillus phyllosphaerae]|uniref:Cellulose synthase/poly-beta-1,6-N-acetylglucosamine synthase-like glycosyltransferase n=1 Tax=Paenibacillus phyllosphaerae TaxID=274593 RepID=A0A7W5FM81_9BACL|nr:glycosyltransferase family 2 protein [Paenibacillus phyllosphaerae]MBB3109724.1 cellulose synthase/poly-beta-1,6-N-acetylglucosamine synthase-like glycosyltransferase [Paenibacillus phyllosphaerae]
MNILHDGFNILFFTVQAVIACIGVYQALLSFAGFRYKKRPRVHAPAKSFAVVVAAHNEEQVIAPLLDNLLRLEYPRELYDIFVICDNCTDKTAAIVREHGLEPMERFDTVNKGKGHAIEWLLGQLWKRERQYDAVVIFDADNLISLNYLAEMNEKLLDGKQVIQGYLETKNPYDSWVSISYAITYWYINRMWQLARFNLGMANTLAGTGMCFDAKLLKEMGWHAHSLTEDVEFTARCVERGITPTWAHEAIVYDEKPITMMSSCRQRLRWLRGHFDCAKRFSWPLLKSAVVHRSFAKFDALLYLFQPFRFLFLASISVMLYLQAGTPLLDQLGINQLVPVWVWWSIHIAIFLQTPLVLAIERKPWRAYLGIIVYPIFQLTWFPLTFIAFFTSRNKSWNHTVHTRALRIEDISLPKS